MKGIFKMDHMQCAVVCEMAFRFRRQHEQLRQVIVRVLRPAVSAVSAGTPEALQPSVEPLAMELADTGSIDVCLCCYTIMTVAFVL